MGRTAAAVALYVSCAVAGRTFPVGTWFLRGLPFGQPPLFLQGGAAESGTPSPGPAAGETIMASGCASARWPFADCAAVGSCAIPITAFGDGSTSGTGSAGPAD